MKLIDLSKQLKISSKKVLKAAGVLNIDFTSDLSIISEEDAQRIIEYFENNKKAGFLFRKKSPIFLAGLLLIGVAFSVISNSSNTSSEVAAQISSEEVLNVLDELAINEDIDEVQITDLKPTPPLFTDSDDSLSTTTTVPVTTTTTVPVTTTTVPVTTTTTVPVTTTTTVPVTTTTTTVPVTCDDESFSAYTLYKTTGEANTVMSCRNEQEALESGYVLTVNPNPPTPTPTTTTTVPPPAGYLTTFDPSGIRAISVDSSKNAYTTGIFNNTADFGGGDVTSNGSNDMFVVKLDSNGSFQWVYTAGGSGGDGAYDIETDSSGNSYITGVFSGTVNFGSGNVTSAGNSDDIYVVKIDSDGNFQWVYTAGGTVFGNSSSLKYDSGRGIDVDSSGNVYITGIFDTVVDFGGGNVSSNGKDIFVLKLDTDGNFQWVYNVLSSGNDYANSITTDPSGNTYTTGYFSNTADFGGGDVTSNGSNDMFVVKLDSNGSFQWVYTAGGTGVDELHAIAIDSSDNVLTTGYFSNTVNFGGGDVTSTDTVTALVLKLDSSGSFDWAQTYSGQGAQEGLGIAADSSDNILTTGYFLNTVDFGDGDVTSTGNEDIYILKLNSSGSFQWIKTYGSTAASTSYYDVSNDITVDTDGSVYTVGVTGENTDFGTGNIAGSSYDSFVLKLTSSGSID